MCSHSLEPIAKTLRGWIFRVQRVNVFNDFEAENASPVYPGILACLEDRRAQRPALHESLRAVSFCFGPFAAPTAGGSIVLGCISRGYARLVVGRCLPRPSQRTLHEWYRAMVRPFDVPIRRGHAISYPLNNSLDALLHPLCRLRSAGPDWRQC
jgi:hypothetical protein